MEIRQLHAWDVSAAEAERIQRELAARVCRKNQLGAIRRVAGVDLAVGRIGERGRAGVVVVAFPELQPVEVQTTSGDVTFPYIPGLLSFRELPIVAQAFEAMNQAPDVVLVDGQGIAHPRRLGIASHLGLLLDLPTVGCAKSILRGQPGPLGEEAGSTAEMVDRGEVVGMAVRTRKGVKPVYVSVGHKVDLPTAVQLVLACCRGYRLPEPTRLAHLAAAGEKIMGW